jgi:AraC-like DNA-binding protein
MKGVQSGADQYIVKPFNMTYLRLSIKSQLKNREAIKQHYSGMSLNTGKDEIISKESIEKKFIDNFNKVLLKNLDNPDFHVENAAESLGMSRVQLYRKVKGLIGGGINDYLTNLRLKKAQELLKNSDMTIAEVGFAVGFSSPAYFSTSFKAKFKISPSEFKSLK